MMKKLKINFIFLVIIYSSLFLLNINQASAEITILNDLYMVYPQSNNNKNQVLDISQSTKDLNTLITYTGHGLGNQLMSYEYIDKMQGYVIHKANSSESLLCATSPNIVKSIKIDVQLNQLTELDESFIWDIELADESENNYMISNRKTGTYMTTSNPKNNARITLESKKSSDKSQQFKFKTMNGVYAIRSNVLNQKNMIWDIEGGIYGSNIIAYPEQSKNNVRQINQEWLITYEPKNDGYLIANRSNKKIILYSNSRTGSPKTITNNNIFGSYQTNQIFYFALNSITKEDYSIVTIMNKLYSLPYYRDTAYNQVSRLGAGDYPSDLNSINSYLWTLDPIDRLPEPKLTNVKLEGSFSGESTDFYVGENITVSGDVLNTEREDFQSFDSYVRIDTDDSMLLGENIGFYSNIGLLHTFNTTSYKEKTMYLEYFVRADKVFISNKAPFKINFKYPTPTGDPIPQNIPKGKKLTQTDAKNFVTNLRDELGTSNKIDVTGIEVDTMTEGVKEATVSLKNNYGKVGTVKVPVNIIDPNAPTGTGKIVVIDQNDYETILEQSDYKDFLKEIQGGSTTGENIAVDLKEGQDIENLAKEEGPKSLYLTLTNSNGNKNEVTVPIYVKKEKSKAVYTDDYLLLGEDIYTNIDDYPSDQSNLKNYIYKQADIKVLKVDTLGYLSNVEKIETDTSIDINQLPIPGEEIIPNLYPFKIDYQNKDIHLSLGLNMTIEQPMAKINVLFVDEANQMIEEPIGLEAKIGDSINLSQNKQIIDRLAYLDELNYQVDSIPANETEIEVKEDITLTYKMKGKLFIKSYPSSMSFGAKHLFKPFISVEKAEYDSEFIIWDNRKSSENKKKNWSLRATLVQPLTNDEDSTQIISNGLYYKLSGSQDRLPLIENQSQEIKTSQNSSNEYDLSKEWNDNNEGLQLSLYSKQVKRDGHYTASILWQLGEAP